MRVTTSIVVGPPGTGKTRRISALVREAVERGRSPLVASLTKAAAREAAGRGMPIPDAMIGTLHAHAFRQLGMPALATGTRLKDWNEAHPEWALTEGAVDADAPFGDGPAGDGIGDKLAAGYHRLRARMTAREEWPSGVVRFAEAWEDWKQEMGLLDFSDVIERARDLGPPGDPSPDVIYVDEAQDHSRLELELLRAWAERAGSLVLVGDPWQALYAWRGAHPAMFDGVRRREVLSQSFRVPRAVHSVATGWIRELSSWEPTEYRPRDEAGSAELLDASWGDPDSIVSLAESHLDVGKSVMVMAACGYMLLPTLGVLRGRGLPFAQPWRKKHGGWNPLRGGPGLTMAERLLALIKPVDGAELHDGGAELCERETLGDPWGDEDGQEIQSEARTFPDGVLVPDSESFDFGANVERMPIDVDTDIRVNNSIERSRFCQLPDRDASSNFGANADPALMELCWTPSDVARWAAVLGAKGVLRRGAKKALETVLAETRETAVSTTIAGQGDLDGWFEAEGAAFLGAAMCGRVERDDLVAWWLERLLPRKQQAARFPCSVLGRRGRQALIDRPRLFIGNIHSFKGAEADVVILFPDLSYRGWRGWNESVEDRDSIVRQMYVGLTRARESVFVCRPAGSRTSSVWEWLN